MSGKTIYPDSDLPTVFLDAEIIADPLNRLIPISKFEKRIICCPEFQRLRRIKQLGFAHFAFPAAEYSRFTHSIGVCHQAKMIVDTINENLRNDRRYQNWRLRGREGDISNTTDEDIFITPFERVIIAVAGLLHDLPHGPFSHEIEGIPTETDQNLIPDHDKLAENPALFLYLFDRNVSEIAVLLDRFNKVYFQAFKSKFVGKLPEKFNGLISELSYDWKKSLDFLMHAGQLTDTGMVRVAEKNAFLQFARKNGKPQPPAERFRELPFLAVAIFEVLLFEKQDEWLSPTEYNKVFKRGKRQNAEDEEWGVIVKTDWTVDAGICWRPIPGWFRAYRKDIVGNTICADLIDYVNRDGYHTGIVSTIDLKFLDRMTIVRAVLPSTGADGRRSLKPPANTINYEDIPVCCEHVVFDIYDHKRGFIRQSVLTEILAYLQARYLLCERVYNHRVVEAARSMLQKIISILGNIDDGKRGKKLLTLSDLHPLDKQGPGRPLAPISDEALLNWVRSLPDIKQEVYKQNASDIDKAIELATLLQERRVFREAVIYDGLHGFLLPGKLGGAEVSCRALEAAFLTDKRLTKQLNKCLLDIEQYLLTTFTNKTKGVPEEFRQRLEPHVKCLVGVRQWGKRYKPPLVLVSRPLKQAEAEHGSFDVEPLLDCEDPNNIKKQLDALKASYDSLWKVYLFLHPAFHSKLFLDEHFEVNKRLDNFAAKYTGEKWKNAIEFKQLLTEPLDNVSFLAEPEKAYFENYLIPSEALKLSQELTKIVTQNINNHASKFAEIVGKENFRLRMGQELSKTGNQETLQRIAPNIPRFFKELITEQIQPDDQQAFPARKVEELFGELVIKAIDEALGDDTRQQRQLNL